MNAVDTVRNDLIDKLLSVKNVEFLKALDDLITSSKNESDEIELTEDQITLLQLSEEDVTYGRVISQEEMMQRNLEWLNGK